MLNIGHAIFFNIGFKHMYALNYALFNMGQQIMNKNCW